MASHPPTILSLKQDFLTAQTRLLSQPLQPTRAWRNSNQAEEAAHKLSEKAIDDALFRLNHTLQQHNRRAYPPQSTRLIAEQIDTLYLTVGENRGRHDDDDEDGGVVGEGEEWKVVGADYTNPDIIASLPPTWDDYDNDDNDKGYADLVTRLQTLSSRAAEARARVLRLRRMQAVLAPFDTQQEQQEEEESTTVQENLVTRNGEVERELERMRMLLVRVGDKVARLKGSRNDDNDDDDLFGEREEASVVEAVEVVERRKIDNLLDGMG